MNLFSGEHNIISLINIENSNGPRIEPWGWNRTYTITNIIYIRFTFIILYELLSVVKIANQPIKRFPSYIIIIQFIN